jgi:hypothetical protein
MAPRGGVHLVAGEASACMPHVQSMSAAPAWLCLHRHPSSKSGGQEQLFAEWWSGPQCLHCRGGLPGLWPLPCLGSVPAKYPWCHSCPTASAEPACVSAVEWNQPLWELKSCPCTPVVRPTRPCWWWHVRVRDDGYLSNCTRCSCWVHLWLAGPAHSSGCGMCSRCYGEVLCTMLVPVTARCW